MQAALEESKIIFRDVYFFLFHLLSRNLVGTQAATLALAVPSIRNLQKVYTVN